MSSEPDYSAEIDRMLGGTGDNPTPGASETTFPPSIPPLIQNPALGEHGASVPGGAPPGARPPQDDPQLVAMRDQLSAAQAERDALRTQLASRPPLPTPDGGVMPQAPANPQQLKAQLEEAFLRDPGGTLLAMGAYMQDQTQKAIQAELAKGTSGLRTDVTDGNVQAFRQKMLADPVLAPAVDEFDKLVKNAAGQLTPGQMSQQLDALASTALGETFRKRLPGQRQQQPPPWTGGMSASPDSGAPSGGAPTQMNAEQKEYVQTMIDMGLPKEVIAERLKNWDAEGGFTAPPRP